MLPAPPNALLSPISALLMFTPALTAVLPFAVVAVLLSGGVCRQLQCVCVCVDEKVFLSVFSLVL